MDETLIDRVRKHDLQALTELLAEQRQPLLAFIDRKLGVQLRRKVEAEDIAQEVCAEAVRSLANMEFGQRDPFSWFCQIAERRIIDSHRHFFGAQKRDAALEVGGGASKTHSKADIVNMLAASMTTASQAFSRNAKEARLCAAMQELPEDQQAVMRMRYVEDLPSKAIAERIGKSDAAVRVMLARTIKKLQELLANE